MTSGKLRVPHEWLPMFCQPAVHSACWCLVVAVSAALPACGEQPLHRKIDQLIRAGSESSRAHISSDEAFHRRLYLDIVGRAPTSLQVRAFLSDVTVHKRQALIDDLLARPGYARHLAAWFDALLMERRPRQHVDPVQWKEFLRTSFLENKPWDRLAHEILSADGTDETIPAASRFYLGRGGQSKLIARDIGRLLLGINLSCAQCHDDLLRTEYRMDDFYGLVAFLNRSFVFQDKEQRPFFAERATGEVSFASAFATELQRTARPRLPGGMALDEATADGAGQYRRVATRLRTSPTWSGACCSHGRSPRDARGRARTGNPRALEWKPNSGGATRPR